ncbi:MAG: F0F1 ATP synthase subunit alpha, partial [Oscillospiraceae bacterium]|nr:F0F1 ATP synthase subunit alpha [Oscillospiraceae bacterium]
SGVRPAVNPGISVSRVGGNAQIKAMKKVSGTLKLDYSQYRELQSFSQFGSDLDQDTKNRLAKGERIVEVLKQDENSPLEVEDQIVIIYAVVNNFLASIPLQKIKQYQKDLLDHIKTTKPELLSDIREKKVISPENETALNELLSSFASTYD